MNYGPPYAWISNLQITFPALISEFMWFLICNNQKYKVKLGLLPWYNTIKQYR
jgi:hypothetical protein